MTLKKRKLVRAYRSAMYKNNSKKSLEKVHRNAMYIISSLAWWTACVGYMTRNWEVSGSILHIRFCFRVSYNMWDPHLKF